MVLAKYGENTELDEDANGNTIIRNTATGTEVLLADFVDIVGSFGSASNRVDGESFFDQVNANSLETGTVIDSDTSTSYDVGDDLASGAFSDADNDGTYTLPDANDGIDVGSVNTDSVAIADTLATQGLAYTMSFGRPLSDPSSTSSATFERIADMVGGVPPYGEAPAGATLQGNLVVNASSVPSGETGSYRVEMLNLDVGGGAAVDELDSITVDVTDSNTTESGWTDIEADLSGGDRYPVTKSLQGKVTSGTLDSNAKDFFVVLFRWVID